MQELGWTLAAAGGAVVLDRLLLAAERRGWIYWRRRSPTSSARSAAMLSTHALLEPDKEHVVEEIQQQQADIDRAEGEEPFGTGPEDGSSAG